MTGRQRGPQRVRTPYVEQLADRLSPRDWAILETLDRVRLATGIQLERLHFSSLTNARSRAVMRWRVLKSLVDARVLLPLGRRVGTALHGSAELRFALDSAGQQLIRMRERREDLQQSMQWTVGRGTAGWPGCGGIGSRLFAKRNT